MSIFRKQSFQAVLVFAFVSGLLLVSSILASQDAIISLSSANGSLEVEQDNTIDLNITLDSADDTSTPDDDIIGLQLFVEYDTSALEFVVYDPAGNVIPEREVPSPYTQADDGRLEFEFFGTSSQAGPDLAFGTIRFRALNGQGSTDVTISSDTALAQEDGTAFTPGLAGAEISFTGADVQAPTVPANFAVSSVDTTSANLTWSASTDPEGSLVSYTIRRDGQIVADGLTVTSYTDSGLEPSNTYTYQITASDEIGNQSASAEVVAATDAAPDTTPPSDPTGLSVSEISQSSARLDWSAATDDSGPVTYSVRLDGADLVNGLGVTSYTVSNLSASTSYAVEVIAVDASGNRSNAATTTFETEQVVINEDKSFEISTSSATINPGDQFTATLYLVNQDDPSITDDDILAFLAEISYDTSRLQFVSYSSATLAPEFDPPREVPDPYNQPDDGVLNVESVGTAGSSDARINLGQFTFIARGTVGATDITTTSGSFIGLLGDVLISPAPSGTSVIIESPEPDPDPTPDPEPDPEPEQDTEAPSTPDFGFVQNVGTDRIDLGWSPSTDNVGVTGYRVYFRQAGGGAFDRLIDTAGVSYSHISLSASTTYEYYVMAFDAEGNFSGSSQILSATTDAVSAPIPDPIPDPDPTPTPDPTPNPDPDPDIPGDVLSPIEPPRTPIPQVPVTPPRQDDIDPIVPEPVEEKVVDEPVVEDIGYKRFKLKVRSKNVIKAYIEYGTSVNNLNQVSDQQTLGDSDSFNVISSNIVPGTKYFYRVVGVDGEGKASYSRVRQLTTRGITVTFILKDKNGEPIRNKKVSLFSDEKVSETDEDGIVTFADVAPGQHTLSFESNGKEVTQAVMVEDTVTLVAGEDRSLTENVGTVEEMQPQEFELAFTFEEGGSGVLLPVSIGIAVLALLAAVFFVGRKMMHREQPIYN